MFESLKNLLKHFTGSQESTTHTTVSQETPTPAPHDAAIIQETESATHHDETTIREAEPAVFATMDSGKKTNSD